MSNDTMQGKWRQLHVNIKTNFGKLSDDDLIQADGNVDKIQGALQERYGYSNEQAQTEWDKFAQQHTGKVEGAQATLVAGNNANTVDEHAKATLVAGNNANTADEHAKATLVAGNNANTADEHAKATLVAGNNVDTSDDHAKDAAFSVT